MKKIAVTSLLGLSLSFSAIADDINVLVMDTPIHYNHSLLREFQPQIPAKILATGTLYTSPVKVSDELYENFEHGTHVAGIIAKKVDVYSENKVKIHNAIHISSPLTEVDDSIDEDFEYSNDALFQEFQKDIKKDIAELQKMINERDIRVVNMSWGEGVFGLLLSSLLGLENVDAMNGNDFIELINKHIRVYKKQYAELFKENPDVLFTIAAGNSQRNMDRKYLMKNNSKNLLMLRAFLDKLKYVPNLEEAFSDLDLDNVIVVAALNEHTNKIASFSNTGKESVDILASGVSVDSSLPNGTWGALSGTSMAAPQVAGVATRIFQENPNLEAKDIKKIIMGTAIKNVKWSLHIKSSSKMNSELAIEAAKLTK